jgi:hypothetical protein
MAIGEIIGSFIIVSLFTFIYLIIQNTKDRKESLKIIRKQNIIILLLTDDIYWELAISDIKDDNLKIKDRVKDLIQCRAWELHSFVDTVIVKFIDDNIYEQELLKIITNYHK